MMQSPNKVSLSAFQKASPKVDAGTNAVTPPVALSGELERDVDPNDPRLQALDPKTRLLGFQGDTEGKHGGDRSVALWAFVCAALRAGITPALVASCVMAWKIGDHVRDQNNPERALQRTIERAMEEVAKDKPKGDRLVVTKWDHMGRARLFADLHRPHVRHYRDDFMDFDGSRYVKVEDGTMKSDIYNCLDNAYVKNDGDGPDYLKFGPNITSVNETVAALKAERHLLPSIEQPCWLGDRGGPNPENLISFKNGILDLETENLLPCDPRLFSCNAVAIDYDRGAADPKNWKEFLKQIYDGEQDQINSLQETFGYCMSADVSQEKAFSLIGPGRSGKDTQKNVLSALLPPGSVIGPTLDSMGTNFGMSAFIYKQLAIIGDMRLGPRCDQDLLAENVLKLTGRGRFTMDRKNKSHWSGQLPCKLLIISNERPRIRDASGVLATRFINYTTRVSFYGKEDRHLFRDKLQPELSGIAQWALEGLKRVRDRGRISEPKSSVEAREQMARDGSPVLAFFHECLKLDPNAEVTKDDLHKLYVDWSAACGLRAKDKNVFMADLIASTGGKVSGGRSSTGNKRVPVARGLCVVQRPPARERQLNLADVVKALKANARKEGDDDETIPF